MDLTFLDLVILFGFSIVFCLVMMLAFALGAYVVYRTKRDSTEPFMAPRQKTGDAGQAQGYYDHEAGDDDPPMGGDVDQLLYGSPERRSSIFENLKAREAEYEGTKG